MRAAVAFALSALLASCNTPPPSPKQEVRRQEQHRVEQIVSGPPEWSEQQVLESQVADLAEETARAAKERRRKKASEAYHTRLVKVLFDRASWPQSDLDRVLKREVWIGARKDYVYVMWGRPDRENNSVDLYHADDFLHYGPLGSDFTIHVQDGKVVGWRN